MIWRSNGAAKQNLNFGVTNMEVNVHGGKVKDRKGIIVALLIISIIVFLPTLFFTKSLSGKTVGGSSGQGNYTKNLKYELNANKTGYILTVVNGSTEEVVIPPTYKDLPVFKIGEGAFFNNDKITSVVIPDSVTIIGDRAFYACNKLSDVTLGNGTDRIGRWAFYNCTSLTSIIIPDSVTSIGSHAFYTCTSLKTINYKGCQEQRDMINKDIYWNYNTGEYTINYNYVEN